MKIWRLLFVLVVVAVFLLWWKKEPLSLAYFAAQIPQDTLEARMALLQKDVIVRTPQDGEGPFPAVLQFHGCAGIRDPFQQQWAEVAIAAGYAVLIIDSNSPRGYSRQDGLDIVCEGKALLGQERAGDIAAAIGLAQGDSRIDAGQLVLAGWSHGAWSIMDFLTMDFARHRPAGLDPLSAFTPDIDGVILFYPYCGPGTWSRIRDWRMTPPMLALVAGADSMVDADQCAKLFKRKKFEGAAIDLIVYEDAEHVFDDPFIEPEYQHWYDADHHRDAARRYREFLERVKSRATP